MRGPAARGGPRHGCGLRMFFNSIHFGVFFPLVFLLYLPLRRKIRARNWLLLIASYYFYGCWDWRFLGLIAASTFVDFLCGLALNVTEADLLNPPKRGRREKSIVTISLLMNLGALAIFKYYDFFVESATVLMTEMGLPFQPGLLDLVLPVGISFYTFQTLSYTIDLYRCKITTERDWLPFAVFVSFFPQLVAGPIERASHLLPQFKEERPLSWQMLYSGFYLICYGLFKKVVLADNAAHVTDAVFAAGADKTGLDVLLATYAFAIQVYCDFSGYSDIARGTARCLGFDVMVNFNLPYFATNPAQFWERWHISLTTWLRDYLFISLGGSRVSSRRVLLNIMLTMTICGLWHGAAWSYVLFGFYHGLLLCGHRLMLPLLGRIAPTASALQAPWWLIRWIVFFHLYCVSLPIFRSTSLAQIIDMFRAVATDLSLVRNIVISEHLLTLLATTLALFAIEIVQVLRNDLDAILRLSLPWRVVFYCGMFFGFIFFGEFTGDAFIYFQF